MASLCLGAGKVGPQREQCREGGLRRIELELHGGGVDRLHANGGLELSLLGSIRVSSGVIVIAANDIGQDVLVVAGVVRVAGPLNAEHEVLGGQGFAIRPLEVLLECDGVGLAIIGDLRLPVGHCRLRDVLEVEVIQAAPDVHLVGDVLGEVGEVRVPGFELGRSDGDGAGRRLGGRGGGFAPAAVCVVVIIVVAAGDGDGHDGEYGEHAQEHPPFGIGHR